MVEHGFHWDSTERRAFDSERWRTAYELGKAALKKDHEVSFFHYLDGALVPVDGQTFPDCSDTGLTTRCRRRNFRNSSPTEPR